MDAALNSVIFFGSCNIIRNFKLNVRRIQSIFICDDNIFVTIIAYRSIINRSLFLELINIVNNFFFIDIAPFQIIYFFRMLIKIFRIS